VLTLIQKLKQKYTPILFTGNFKPVFENYQKKINMQEYFDHLFLSYEYGRRKDDPEMWNLILEKTKLNPEEVLFIDDNPRYIEIARNRGVRSILFTNQEVTEIIEAIE
jgi:putative hydrolase of the HAD superfamily